MVNGLWPKGAWPGPWGRRPLSSHTGGRKPPLPLWRFQRPLSFVAMSFQSFKVSKLQNKSSELSNVGGKDAPQQKTQNINFPNIFC